MKYRFYYLPCCFNLLEKQDKNKQQNHFIQNKKYNAL